METQQSYGAMRAALTRRRFLRTSGALGAGLTAAALVGCSSNGAKPTANAPAAGSSGATASGPTSASIIGNNWGNREPDTVPKYGGTLNYANPNPPLAHLDTLQPASGYIHDVTAQVYSNLTRISRDAKDRNTPKVYYPDLATGWEISDPLKMTFKLRSGVKFHNLAPVNGRAFSAEDVKYSINRAATDKASPWRSTYEAIKSIDIPDPNTIVFNLSKFDAQLFNFIGGNAGEIVPHELVEASKIRELAIGTGPFIFQKWDQDSRISFKKNPDYFIKGTPFIDELNLLQIANEETRTTALLSGQTQVGTVPPPNVPQFQDKSKFNVESYLTTVTMILFMNFKEPRWKDVRLRQAVALALDTDVMVKILADGNGLWRGIVSNEHAGFVLSQDELKSNKYFKKQDLQRAKQLMSAAGNPNGISTGLLYNTTYPQRYQDAMQYMAETLTKNQIATVKPVGQDQATMRKNQDEHNYDGLCFGLDGENTPEAFILDFKTGGPKNGSGLSDPEVDADVNKVLGTVDIKERQAASRAFIDKYLQKVMYKHEFADKVLYDGYSTNTHNWIAGGGGQNASFNFTWLGKA